MPIYIRDGKVWRELTLMYLRKRNISIEEFVSKFKPSPECEEKVKALETLGLAVKIGEGYISPYSITKCINVDECVVYVSDEIYKILSHRR